MIEHGPNENVRTPGIRQITVAGFKSIRDERSIELRPLTLLAGANSSGKSSMIQPLLMLKQTLEATYDPGPLLIDGPNVRFTRVDQFFSRGVARFRLGLVSGVGTGVSLTFSAGGETGIRLDEMEAAADGKTFILRPDMTREAIGKMVGKQLRKGVGVRNVRCFLAVTGLTNTPYLTPLLQATGAARVLAAIPVQSLIHVPALRGNPERTYKTTPIGPMFPGTFDNYVASVIRSWQQSEVAKMGALGEQLRNLGLTWQVCTQRVDDTQVEISVARLPHKTDSGADDFVSIADVGVGLSQVLPVLVALLAAQKDQIVYIEQPEIHLHPKAQWLLAEVLGDAARRGVIVIAETHSAFVLLGVQRLVATKKLSPELVKLYWFTRSPETGVTDIASADLDEQGRYGDWPEDFGKVTLDAEQGYLDAVESQLFGGK